MLTVKLLLDEDVWVGLASALKETGYDVVTVNELNRKGLTDETQLQFSIAENRLILTHNIQDFVPLAVQLFEQSIAHPGILVARQYNKGVLISRTLALLESTTPEQLANTVRFI